MKRTLKWILLGFLALLVIATAGFVIWGSTPLGPMPEAQAALQSGDGVTVERAGGWVVFTPAGQDPSTGFIFYPGGRVDYRSYAPALKQIAAQGYRVVLVPMPLSLAVMGANRANKVIAAYPQVQHWAIGGHSLGGAMAALYADQHPEKVQGLVFWAAYPAGSNDLSGTNIKVVSIYGSQDGVASRGTIDASKALLPASAQFIRIEGGNHAQFGWYGPQPGDGAATITRQAQQDQAVADTVALLSSLGGGQ